MINSHKKYRTKICGVTKTEKRCLFWFFCRLKWGNVVMKIIKRSGTEVKFNLKKIVNAITAANKDVDDCNQLSEEKIVELAKNVEAILEEKGRVLTVEEIQDLVENQLMDAKAFVGARKYIT